MSYEQYKQNLNTLNLRPYQAHTVENIKTAYRKLVLKHHPDRFRTQVSKARATEDFKRITKAYEEVLADFDTYKDFEEPKQEQKQKAKVHKQDVKKYTTPTKEKQQQQKKTKQAPAQYKARLDFDTLFTICFDEVIM
jgi:DnaJ-class molecular chaperone